MKFRKKPVVIEAFQYSVDEIPEWALKALDDGRIEDFSPDHGHFGNLEIKTLEGDHLARPGDYIIKGVNGELYPCKPDIFAKTYDKVDEDE